MVCHCSSACECFCEDQSLTLSTISSGLLFRIRRANFFKNSPYFGSCSPQISCTCLSSSGGKVSDVADPFGSVSRSDLSKTSRRAANPAEVLTRAFLVQDMFLVCKSDGGKVRTVSPQYESYSEILRNLNPTHHSVVEGGFKRLVVVAN